LTFDFDEKTNQGSAKNKNYPDRAKQGVDWTNGHQTEQDTGVDGVRGLVIFIGREWKCDSCRSYPEGIYQRLSIFGKKPIPSRNLGDAPPTITKHPR